MASAGELTNQFERALTHAVHGLVRMFQVARPAYCLALNYGGDPSGGCIPVLGLGLLDDGESISPPTDRVSPEPPRDLRRLVVLSQAAIA